jgi:hypothetical protein
MIFGFLYPFWVIPRGLNFICRRFGAICLFHPHGQCKQDENIQFRRRGIVQKREYNSQNMSNVGNQDYLDHYWL